MKGISSLRKNLKVQSSLIIITAIVLGLLTYFYLTGYQSRLASESKLSPVYVASSEIEAGTSFSEMVSSALLAVKELPAGSIPTDALTPSDNLQGSLKTRGPLTPGQLVTSSFFTAESRVDVGLLIPKGKLALTISVDDVDRVGNFVAPGSRVAIFTSGSGASNSTNILLGDVLVIGIGDQTQVTNQPTQVTPSPLVTLALTPSQARLLISATQNSRLTLALAHQNNPSAVINGEASAIDPIAPKS